jgi:hypothetical protein
MAWPMPATMAALAKPMLTIDERSQRGGLDRADERHGGIGLALNLKLSPGADVAPANSVRGGKKISSFAHRLFTQTH